MISLYTGTPGSGKSLHCAKTILRWLFMYKSNIISVNLKLNREECYKDKKKYRRRFLDFKWYKNRNNKRYFQTPRSRRGVIYNIMDFDKLSPEVFYKYAARHHIKGKEHQTLIVIDEAQMVFDDKLMKEKDQYFKELLNQKKTKNYISSDNEIKKAHAYEQGYRKSWDEFFSHHRHLGYDIIIITQFDKLISPRVRAQVEYNYVHRKVNNYSFGFVLSLFGISIFLCKTWWYQTKMSTGTQFFGYNKRFAKIYDSYKLFDEILARYHSSKASRVIEISE